MKAVSKTKTETAKEILLNKMALLTMANGRTIKNTALEYGQNTMVKSTKANGKTVSAMEKEKKNGQMAANMLDFINMICSMVKVTGLEPMEITLQESTKKENNMVMESSLGSMAINTMVIGSSVKDMDKENFKY